MLHTVTAGHFVPPVSPAIKTSRTKPSVRAQSSPSLRDMIEQYRQVKAELAIAKGRCTKLFKRHPELEERRPLVKICERIDGSPILGRWLHDFDRIYPPGEQTQSSDIRAKRRKFKKQCEDALVAHKLAREASGIDCAERQRGCARGKRGVLFRKISSFRPSSKVDAGLMANFLLKELPHFVEANVFTDRPSKTAGDYDRLVSHQVLAFYYTVDTLRAIAKA
jgi:hypothetical protein